VLAANQSHAAKLLEGAHAVRLLSLNADMKNNTKHLAEEMTRNTEGLRQMSNQAQKISDGQGCKAVVLKLFS
jgi:hypothetical protein